MNIVIHNGKDIEFGGLRDLEQLIPRELSGEVLNYGQGEGQVKIEGTIWGIYVTIPVALPTKERVFKTIKIERNSPSSRVGADFNR